MKTENRTDWISDLVVAEIFVVAAAALFQQLKIAPVFLDVVARVGAFADAEAFPFFTIRQLVHVGLLGRGHLQDDTGDDRRDGDRNPAGYSVRRAAELHDGLSGARLRHRRDRDPVVLVRSNDHPRTIDRDTIMVRRTMDATDPVQVDLGRSGA